jgi:RNA polymerase sigma-70 factor (ECF subfamily)
VLDLLESRWAEPDGGGWSDRAEALDRCVGGLADHARDLLRLRYANGMTAAAIAAKLSRTAAAVYQSLSRIHRALRECVEGELAGRSAAGRKVSS